MNSNIKSRLADDGELQLVAEICGSKEVCEWVRINAQGESTELNTRAPVVDVRTLEERHWSSQVIMERALLNRRALT